MAFATVTPRLAASLLGAFSVLALTLAAVGLHSVLAYSVSQRTREVAIRLALGARPLDVRALIVRQGMWLLVVGIVTGTTIAYGALPFMAPLLISIFARRKGNLPPWVRCSRPSRSRQATCPPAARGASIRSSR